MIYLLEFKTHNREAIYGCPFDNPQVYYKLVNENYIGILGHPSPIQFFDGPEVIHDRAFVHSL